MMQINNCHYSSINKYTATTVRQILNFLAHEYRQVDPDGSPKEGYFKCIFRWIGNAVRSDWLRVSPNFSALTAVIL